MEEKKAKGSSGEDLISKLPDYLISHILSSLPTKESVKTSVLSRRWKSLWLLTLWLDLNSNEFPNLNAFVGFTEKFIAFSNQHKSCLHNLKLNLHQDFEESHSCITHWIDFVATPKLNHLDLECHRVKSKCLKVMPLSLYVNQSLLTLRLCQVSLGSFDSHRVSLPRLKTMSLEENIYANEACFELLISSCSVLDDLSIVRKIADKVNVIRVHSKTLSSLSIESGRDRDDDDLGEDDDDGSESKGVLIVSPRLKYLNLVDTISASKTVINSSSLAKVNLLHNFSTTDEVGNFFNSFSGVSDMKIRWHRTLKLVLDIKPYPPRFCNMTRLEIELEFFGLDQLLKILKSFPNLKSLILEIFGCLIRNHTGLGSVPECLLSSLEFVKIKYQDRRNPLVEELVRYFVENSVILKELSLALWYSTPERNAAILEELLALPRPSSTCRISFC